MNVLLLSMPDSFEHMPAAGVRMPNGALSSLAGNVDSHHRVAVADLILVQRHVRGTVTQLVNDWQPDVVGLSIMTFQRKTAKRIINLIRELKPDVHVVAGGYDPTGTAIISTITVIGPSAALSKAKSGHQNAVLASWPDTPCSEDRSM